MWFVYNDSLRSKLRGNELVIKSLPNFGRNFLFYEPALANVNPQTICAPASFKTLAAASIVAPLVKTSSQIRTHGGTKPFTEKEPSRSPTLRSLEERLA
jgi:hypothetical protein